jgi:cyclohexanecarboxylate-CoA ligase/acyl-CoA synthetase
VSPGAVARPDVQRPRKETSMAVKESGLYQRLEHASDVYSTEQMADFKARGLWRDRVLVDFLDEHAAERPDAVAVVDETSRTTWGQLAGRVNRLAAAFVDLGLAPGDFVGVQLPNRVEFLEVYLAIQRAGLRAITMMSIYREKDVTFMLSKCRAKAYVAVDRHRGFDFVAMARSVADAVPTLEHVVIVGEAGEGMLPYAGLLRDEEVPSSAFAALRPDPDSMSKVAFTSGTTGFPKGVVHTHNTDLVPPMMTIEAFGLSHETPLWMPSPIAHATGLAFGVHNAVITGAKLVLQDVWDAERALELISRERAVFTVSATPFIAGMLEVENRSEYDLSSFRYFASGGARIPTTLVERARDELGCWLLRVFGQAEAPLHTVNLPSDPWEKLLERDGRPFDGVVCRIVDPETRSRELPRGEVGEYSTWGPHVFLGYYDNPEATWEAKDEKGWYYSSDLCTMDEDDFVLYVDRIKDIVNRGGVKISALEVENLLAGHPGIHQSAIVAVPDARLGERACAFVVAKPGCELSLQNIGEFLERKGVTKQKWPEQLELVDSLPMTSTGKIQKNVLRDRLANDH